MKKVTIAGIKFYTHPEDSSMDQDLKSAILHGDVKYHHYATGILYYKISG